MEIRQPQAPPPVPPLVPAYGLARPSMLRTVRPGRFLSDLVMVAGLVAILALAMSVVGRLMTIFMDFHVKLPAVTLALMNVHDVYDRYYGWAFVWVVPLAAPLALSQFSPKTRRRWFVAGYLLVGLLIVALILALMFPLTTLIQGIQGPPGSAPGRG